MSHVWHASAGATLGRGDHFHKEADDDQDATCCRDVNVGEAGAVGVSLCWRDLPPVRLDAFALKLSSTARLEAPWLTC